MRISFSSCFTIFAWISRWRIELAQLPSPRSGATHGDECEVPAKSSHTRGFEHVRAEGYAPSMPDSKRHPENPAQSGPLTHWVDTNVMLEVYSHGDLFDAFESYQRGEGDLAAVEERRLRIQGSLWMAMALCRAGARSVTYQHENVRNILRMAPPDSERGGWTSTILWMLGDHGVFDGWGRNMTNDGRNLTNRERDRHMVAECRSDGLVLVTRDAEVIGEARAVGVDAADPETFAVRHLTREDARRTFDERMGTAALGYVVASPAHEHELRMRAGRRVREIFTAVWQSPNEPLFR